MNTDDLDRVLRMVIKPPYQFCGVYPRDALFHLGPVPAGSCLVVNTDPSWRPGQHWVGIFVPLYHRPGSIIFFDSYALPLHLYLSASLNRWLTRQSLRIETSPFAIQPLTPDSDACGPHVVYVLTHLTTHACYQEDLDRLIRCEFSPRHLRDNDAKVWQSYKRRLKKMKK